MTRNIKLNGDIASPMSSISEVSELWPQSAMSQLGAVDKVRRSFGKGRTCFSNTFIASKNDIEPTAPSFAKKSWDCGHGKWQKVNALTFAPFQRQYELYCFTRENEKWLLFRAPNMTYSPENCRPTTRQSLGVWLTFRNPFRKMRLCYKYAYAPGRGSFPS